ncbi:hypothetical protein ACFYQA_24635 [Streptomyces sp. NPDC005774]|uniref:hypothetical protein n=1 Tax=Streptomyces sp. NPDC005774 TaxID=3364728 RepID=UPI0036C8A3BD
MSGRSAVEAEAQADGGTLTMPSDADADARSGCVRRPVGPTAYTGRRVAVSPRPVRARPRGRAF